MAAMSPEAGGIILAVKVGAMKVRLIRKHAECIDDVDLSSHRVGDVLELHESQGALLVAEKWAIPERRERAQPTASRRRADDDPEEGIRRP